MSIEDIDTNPIPCGELALQTIAMPKDTNANGDILGGWLLSQMDLAGGIAASEVAVGRVATVAIEGMSFLGLFLRLPSRPKNYSVYQLIGFVVILFYLFHLDLLGRFPYK